MNPDDIFAAAIAYEAIAVLTGRVPTITCLCRRHPSAVLTVAAVFLGHVYGGRNK